MVVSGVQLEDRDWSGVGRDLLIGADDARELTKIGNRVWRGRRTQPFISFQGTPHKSKEKEQEP